MKLKRRIISIILSILFIGLIPISAFAIERDKANVYFPSKITNNGVQHSYEYNSNNKSVKENTILKDGDSLDEFDGLFMLPRDVNRRNIVLSEMALEQIRDLAVMLSDASMAEKITEYSSNLGDTVSYKVNDKKIIAIQYKNVSSKSTVTYANGNLTELCLKTPGYEAEPYTETYKISYKNGVVTKIKIIGDEGTEDYQYTTDKQGRVTRIQYKSAAGDVKVGILTFSYDKTGNVIAIVNNYHWESDMQSLKDTIKLSYKDGYVTKINVSSTDSVVGNKVITAQYQKL